MQEIRVIDLFAGPGGLGEGFSAYQSDSESHPFRIVASVEHEKSAHQTLTLRAFYRQFLNDGVPDSYYEYLKQGAREPLESAFPDHADKVRKAREETLQGPCSLGSPEQDKFIHDRIKSAVAGHDGPKIVIGGPPCQAYSLVGRARNRGITDYQPENDTRHYLYREYLRVLDEVEPEIFVMENVKGILTSKVNGERIFPKIRQDLENPGSALGNDPSTGYRLYPLTCRTFDAFGDDHPAADSDFVIRTEEFGVPQARHRVIVLGIRKDLADGKKERPLLDPYKAGHPVTAEEVLADLPALRSGLSKQTDSPDAWAEVLRSGRESILRALNGMPAAQQKAQEAADGRVRNAARGGNFVPSTFSTMRMPEKLRDWFQDPFLQGYLNHETRSHMPADLHRYLFASCYAAAAGGVSPKTSDYPADLIPAHRSWTTGNFVDRFKVQARNRVPSTVTSHIAKDGHYFIHYDPFQCRSLTVREAARIQTFPDNYYFCGGRTQQYTQVGNAVPPFLAWNIAKTVHEILKLNFSDSVSFRAEAELAE